MQAHIYATRREDICLSSFFGGFHYIPTEGGGLQIDLYLTYAWGIDLA